MDPNFYDLRYFLEVAQSGNISRAAERIGISQPSLTQSIQRLEAATDTPLFLRSKKGVELTHAGKKMRAHVQLLISSWENLKHTAKSTTTEVAGIVRLGCHVSVALYSVPHFLPDLIKQYSQLEVQIDHDLSRKITDKVIQFELDLGIVVNPTPHPDLVIHSLATDTVTLWGRNQNHDVLIYDPNLLQSQDLIKKMKRLKWSIARTIQTTSLELATSLAVSGAGVAILPSRVVSEHGQNKIKPLKNAPKFHDEITLIYRVENKNLKTIQEFSEAIKKIFKS